MSDDRKRQRSWRDIDRNKDRSAHRSDEPKGHPRGPKGRASASRSHRSALDQLFDSGRIGELVKERDAPRPGSPPGIPPGPPAAPLTQKIEQATTKDDKIAAIDDYLERFTLPADFDLLSHVLEHPDPDVVGDALDKLDKLLADEKPRRARTLIAQLRNLEDLSEWGKLRRRAAALLEKL